MYVNFTKWSPAGNTTLLVTTPLPRSAYAAVAARLMAPDGLSAEQVGFLDGLSLTMAGGEFCGNALRCTGALAALQDRVDGPQEWFVESTALGTACRVTTCKRDEGVYDVSVQFPPLPTPQRLELEDAQGETYVIWRVPCPGITHYIFRHSRNEVVPGLVEQWRERQGETGAYGINFYVEEAELFWPLVTVPGLSRIWERSCASGTAALARLMSCEGKNGGLLRQPGGELSYSADGPVVTLGGSVALIARGQALVPDLF